MPLPYDLAIIGGGPGSYNGAIRASQLGMRAVLIEDPSDQCDTIYHGLLSSQLLIAPGQLLHQVKQSPFIKLSNGGFELRYEQMMERLDKVIQKIDKNSRFLLQKNRVDVVKGKPQIINPHKIQVCVPDTEELKELEVKNILLARGVRAKTMTGLEPDGVKIVDIHHAVRLKHLPESVLVVGSGPVGVEFACHYHFLGIRTILLELQSHLLPGLHADIGKELEKGLKKHGIDVLSSVGINLIDRQERGLRVVLENRDKQLKEIYVEQIFVDVGFVASIDGIGLENVNVELDRGCIYVDSRFHTSCPNIYATGAITTHAPHSIYGAWYEAKLAVESIAGYHEGPMPWTVPECVYSRPEVATVGLSETQAAQNGIQIKIGKFSYKSLTRSIIDEREIGFIKVLLNAGTGVIVGAEVVGEQATELIYSLSMMISQKMTIKNIERIVPAHPSYSEIILEAMLNSENRSLQT